MKRILSISVVLLAFTLLNASCQKEDLNNPASSAFQLLNEKGSPSTEFSQGENFILSFTISNSGPEQLLLSAFDSKDFFTVYRLNEKSNDYIEVGTPYKNMFCTFQAGYLIAPKDSLVIQLPWQINSWDTGTPYYSTMFCGINQNDLLNSGTYPLGLHYD